MMLPSFISPDMGDLLGRTEREGALYSLCSATLGFFAAAQDLEGLIQPPALLDEFVRRSGIEFKHFKMAGYDDFGLDVLSQLRSLASE